MATMNSFLTTFRFDVDIYDMEGKEIPESIRINKIIESSNTVQANFCIGVNEASEFVHAMTLPDRFSKMTVHHCDEYGNNVFTMNYTIESLKDWYLVLSSDNTGLLTLNVIWNAEPSIVVKTEWDWDKVKENGNN